MSLFIQSAFVEDIIAGIHGSPVNYRSIPSSVITINAIEVRPDEFDYVRYATKNLLDLERWDILSLCGWYRCEVVNPVVGADKILGEYGFVFDVNSLVITATKQIVDKALGVVKKESIDLVRATRGLTLDRFTLNHPGVQMIYDANREAVRRYRAGDTTLLYGKNHTEHLLPLAEAGGFSIDEFADYIESESARIGPSAHEVERQYIEAITYINKTGDDAPTAAEIAVKAQQFEVFCKTVKVE